MSGRHGLALDQIFAEVREGEHDLIVTGTSQARGPLRHYIMGDLTRGILNRADCPVLVARAGKIVDDEDAEGGFSIVSSTALGRAKRPNECRICSRLAWPVAAIMLRSPSYETWNFAIAYR